MELQEYMKSLGFIENMKTGDGKIRTFLWEPGLKTNTVYSCEINMENKNFTLQYMSGATFLTLGPASPYDMEGHFRRMCDHFYERVKLLSTLEKDTEE